MSQEELFAKKITAYLKEGEKTITPSIVDRLALARESALIARKKEIEVVHNNGLLALIKNPFVSGAGGLLAAGALVAAVMVFKFTSVLSLYPSPEELQSNSPAYQMLNKTLVSWGSYEKDVEEDLSSLDAYVLYQDANSED